MAGKVFLGTVRRAFAPMGFLAALSAPGAGQVTSLVSLSEGGTQANGACFLPAVSDDGRIVVFVSSASNLAAADTNPTEDVFVRDRFTGTTELVSVAPGGFPGNAPSRHSAVSANGRYVAFFSCASNLVPGDSNLSCDIFVRDRVTGTTELASVATSGAQGNGDSFLPAISSDGRFVAFMSQASNLVTGDTNATFDVFVRDRIAGTTERVSVGPGGVQGNDQSVAPSISADGRHVAFSSAAANLVPGDTNGVFDVFVRDRVAGSTERVSVDSTGAQGNGPCGAVSISGDGRYVAFDSEATNLVVPDANGSLGDVFVRDRQAGTTELASLDSGAVQGDGLSLEASISADGRFVAFMSTATNLVAGDTNVGFDVFVRDRSAGTTVRVSVDSSGAEAGGSSSEPSISADGRFVVFGSGAENLVLGDSNHELDVFLRDRNAAGFSGLCDPGAGGVVACPCANPAAAPGLGCDNSASTGGASLSASGAAYLSMDGLLFTTAGERPDALSVLLQGTAAIPSGTVNGQGVRCAGGTLRRLYVKTAVGGVVTAPEAAAGDPSVSARSAALGDPILAGRTRWYVVVYRDPVVQGGCPSSSTLNATPTGAVSWSP